MVIKAVSSLNHFVLLNLMQAYEAEFSCITGKKPKADGLFSLDTTIDQQHEGWILYKDESPIGFAIVGKHSLRHDIAEFYVVPSLRGGGLGSSFAQEIFRKYPGEWQVRQIQGADLASRFWRKTISEITGNNFLEIREQDEYWGPVTKQLFTSDDFVKKINQAL